MKKHSESSIRLHGMRVLTFLTPDKNEEAMAITDSFVALAEKNEYSPTALAIAWGASNKAVTSPLLEATKCC